MQDEFWPSVQILILVLSDLPCFPWVKSTSSIPASQNEHLNGEHNQPEMRHEDLQEDSHDNWHSDHKVPSHVKIFKRSNPLRISLITGQEQIVVCKDEHDCIVDILENENSHSSVCEVVCDVLGVSVLANKVEDFLDTPVSKGDPESQ